MGDVKSRDVRSNTLSLVTHEVWRDVVPEIHGAVQNPADFNYSIPDAIDDQVATAHPSAAVGTDIGPQTPALRRFLNLFRAAHSAWTYLSACSVPHWATV